MQEQARAQETRWLTSYVGDYFSVNSNSYTCKSKLGHKKLKKITLGIKEGTGNILADFVTLDHFW